MSKDKNKKPTSLASQFDTCERCGSKIIHLSFDRVGSLTMQLVECEKGHRYTRFRLIDIGE